MDSIGIFIIRWGPIVAKIHPDKVLVIVGAGIVAFALYNIVHRKHKEVHMEHEKSRKHKKQYRKH